MKYKLKEVDKKSILKKALDTDDDILDSRDIDEKLANQLIKIAPQLVKRDIITSKHPWYKERKKRNQLVDYSLSTKGSQLVKSVLIDYAKKTKVNTNRLLDLKERNFPGNQNDSLNTSEKILFNIQWKKLPIKKKYKIMEHIKKMRDEMF